MRIRGHKLSPLLLLLLGVGLALGVAVLFVSLTLNFAQYELASLVTFMTASGVTTVVLAYLIYQQGMVRWFSSLRGALLTSIIITVLLVLPNVWVTAQLMFINEQDFYLTTALLIFAGITSVSFGLYVASALVIRIRALSGAAESLAQGRLETRLEVVGKDELADFARTFNWMAERLQQLDEQKRMVEQTRRDLIAGVSHDLRTPLTSIRVMLEALADGVANDPQTMTRYINQSLIEVDNLSHLIDDLFQLAQLDAGHVEMQTDVYSLRDLISDTLSSVRVRAEQRGLRLNVRMADDVDPVCMAPDKIQRVLYNLLDNALRYTPQGGIITLTARRRDRQIEVEVHNTGAVIPPEHLPNIFNSFYRVETSRAQSDDGHRSTGLGLAIARGFVEAHGGSIQAESSAEAGTIFRFVIPRGSVTQVSVKPRRAAPR